MVLPSPATCVALLRYRALSWRTALHASLLLPSTTRAYLPTRSLLQRKRFVAARWRRGVEQRQTRDCSAGLNMAAGCVQYLCAGGVALLPFTLVSLRVTRAGGADAWRQPHAWICCGISAASLCLKGRDVRRGNGGRHLARYQRARQ